MPNFKLENVHTMLQVMIKELEDLAKYVHEGVEEDMSLEESVDMGRDDSAKDEVISDDDLPDYADRENDIINDR